MCFMVRNSSSLDGRECGGGGCLNAIFIRSTQIEKGVGEVSTESCDGTIREKKERKGEKNKLINK